MVYGKLKKHRETEYEVEVDWELEDFLSYSNYSAEYKSPPFIWLSETWQFSFRYSRYDCIMLYTYRMTGRRHLKVTRTFFIRLIDGTKEMRSFAITDFHILPGDCVEAKDIYKSELERRKHEMLPGGILTISCSLAIFINPPSVKYESLDVLSSNLKSLYGCTKSSDIKIAVGKRRYKVHKSILMARSEVFSAMFQHDMEETKTGIIKVSDCDPSSFKDFLLYLYTGSVENFTSNNVCHLYKTADKYNVQELKKLCVRYMKRNLSVTNFFDIVLLAEQFDETELMSLAEMFFNMNAFEIFKEDYWEQFLKQNFPIANQFLIRYAEKNMATGDLKKQLLLNF